MCNIEVDHETGQVGIVDNHMHGFSRLTDRDIRTLKIMIDNLMTTTSGDSTVTVDCLLCVDI